jgi:hypothetical protein
VREHPRFALVIAPLGEHETQQHHGFRRVAFAPVIGTDRDAVLEPARTWVCVVRADSTDQVPVPMASTANWKRSPSDLATACSFAQARKLSAERGGWSRSPNRSSSTAKPMNAVQPSGSIPRRRIRLPVQNDPVMITKPVPALLPAPHAKDPYNHGT